MEFLYISLLGGVLVLDTAAMLQILISQPLVSGTLIGLFFGNTALGLETGALLQLLWLNQIPVGAAKVPSGNLASIVAVILMLRLSAAFPEKLNILLLLVVILTLIISYAGVYVTTFIRNWNIRLLHRADDGLKKGNAAILGQINFVALLIHLIIVVLAIIFFVTIGTVLINWLLPQLPAEWNPALRFLRLAIIGSGLGLTLKLYLQKENLGYLAGGFLAGLASISLL